MTGPSRDAVRSAIEIRLAEINAFLVTAEFPWWKRLLWRLMRRPVVRLSSAPADLPEGFIWFDTGASDYRRI